jgi:hypothetical protein
MYPVLRFQTATTENTQESANLRINNFHRINAVSFFQAARIASDKPGASRMQQSR